MILQLFFLFLFIALSSSAAIPAAYENLTNVNDYNHCLLDYLNSVNVISYTEDHDESKYPSCTDFHSDINTTMTIMYKVLKINLEKEIDNPTETKCLLDVFKHTKFLEYSVIATTAMTLEKNWELLAQVTEISKGIFVHATIQCLFSNKMLQDLFADFSMKLSVTPVEYDCIRADVFERRLIESNFDESMKKFEEEKVSSVNENVSKVFVTTEMSSEMSEEVVKIFDDAKRDFGAVMQRTSAYETREVDQRKFKDQVTPLSLSQDTKNDENLTEAPQTSSARPQEISDDETEKLQVKSAEDANESIEHGRKLIETETKKSEDKIDDGANFSYTTNIPEVVKLTSSPQSFIEPTTISQIANVISKEESVESSELSSEENDRRNQKRNATKSEKSVEAFIEIINEKKTESSERSQEAQVEEAPKVTEIIPIKLKNSFKVVKKLQEKVEEMTTMKSFNHVTANAQSSTEAATTQKSAGESNEVQDETTKAPENLSNRLLTIKDTTRIIFDTTEKLKDASIYSSEVSSSKIFDSSVTIEPPKFDESLEAKIESSKEKSFETSTMAQVSSENLEEKQTTFNLLISSEETLSESAELEKNSEKSVKTQVESSQQKLSQEVESFIQNHDEDQKISKSSDETTKEPQKLNELSSKSSQEKLSETVEISTVQTLIESFEETSTKSSLESLESTYAKRQSQESADVKNVEESPLKFDLMTTIRSFLKSDEENSKELENVKENSKVESSKVDYSKSQEIKNSESFEDQKIENSAAEVSSTEIDKKFKNLSNSLEKRANPPQLLDFLPIGDSNIKKRDLSQKSLECPSILAALSSRIKNYNLESFKSDDNECMSQSATSKDVDDVFAFIVMQKIAKGSKQEEFRRRKFVEILKSVVMKYVDCTDAYGLAEMLKTTENGD